MVTVATTHQFLGRSKQAVNEAIAALKRNRAWEARDLFDLIDDFERALGPPTDDVPSRPSPRGRTTFWT